MGQYAALARVLGLLVAAAGLFFSGWYVNGLRHERNALASDADRQSALSQELAEERERANGYSEQVIELLKRPPAASTVRTLIRENPSKCVRPVPVTDGLRAEVDRANQAIAASRNNGVLPGNPSETK